MHYRLTHANRAIHVGERIEFDMELGQRRTWPQLAVGSQENFVQLWKQGLSKVARKLRYGRLIGPFRIDFVQFLFLSQFILLLKLLAG